MALYLVNRAAGGGVRKADQMVVSAADLDDAKAFCNSQFGSESADWASATFSVLADVAGNADDALIGWRFRVQVISPAGAVVANVAHVGTDADDDMDAIAAALVILLNATAIDNASFSTPTLTVATGSGGDDLGDHTVLATVLPPIVNDAGGVRENEDVPIPGYVATVTDEGATTAALTVVYSANTYVRPTLFGRFQRGRST